MKAKVLNLIKGIIMKIRLFLKTKLTIKTKILILILSTNKINFKILITNNRVTLMGKCQKILFIIIIQIRKIIMGIMNLENKELLLINIIIKSKIINKDKIAFSLHINNFNNNLIQNLFMF